MASTPFPDMGRGDADCQTAAADGIWSKLRLRSEASLAEARRDNAAVPRLTEETHVDVG